MDAETKAEVFWQLAQPMLMSGEADKSTMMGFPCLRSDGKFFASLHRETNDLIVKLPAERVASLIDAGQAQPFAPNGRRFREWALIAAFDEKQWAAYIQEARAFVETQ
jgi:hypothetical protein